MRFGHPTPYSALPALSTPPSTQALLLGRGLSGQGSMVGSTQAGLLHCEHIARRPPTQGDFWILKMSFGPCSKTLAKNHFWVQRVAHGTGPRPNKLTGAWLAGADNRLEVIHGRCRAPA